MKKNFIAIIFFLILTILMTYPLTFKINNAIPGFSSSDEPYAMIWNFWWIKYAHSNKLSVISCPLIAVPFGEISNKALPYPFPFLIWNFVNETLLFFSNEVVTYNIEILLSFLLSGLFVCLLVKHLIGDLKIGIFSGIIYAFSPYHFARAWQHLSLAQIQWMPLYILSLLRIKEEPRIKYALFCALSLFLVASFDFYYTYFMLIVTLLFLIFIAISKHPFKIYAYVFLAMFIFSLMFLPTVFPLLKNMFIGLKSEASAFNLYLRSFEDLFRQSARPLSYFLPSTEHPLFGSFTQRFVGSNLWGTSYTEHQLFLGWIPLIFSFIAFRRWRKAKKMQDRRYALQVNERSRISFFVFLAIAAWLFSQSPWWKIGPLKIFMPSFFMYRILPMFRAYCRFGIVVMLAISVLAGFGLKFMLEKFRTQKTKVLITCIFSALVLFEFLNFPPFKVIDLTKYSKVYDWLKEQPDDIVIAEYPLDVKGPSMGPRELYRFYQTKHHKKIINATIEGTQPYKLAQSIIYLSKPESPAVLKWLGVKYVFVHKDLYDKTGLIDVLDDFNNMKNTRGLKFIKNFDNVYVYEVTAKPKEPKVYK